MLKKKIYIIFALFIYNWSYTYALGSAQHPDISYLRIGWTIKQNHYEGKDQTLSVLILGNTGNQILLPVSGWKLYFNCNRNILPLHDDGQFRIDHINGGLYCLYPGLNFKGLAGRQKIPLECLSEAWMLNAGDAPQGFYIVWNDEPGVGIAVHNIEINAPADIQNLSRFIGDVPASPQVLYQMNERSTKIQDDQICKIFPKPVSYRETSGYFSLRNGSIIGFDELFKNEAALLRQDIKTLGYQLSIHSAAKKAAIFLRKDVRIKNGYTLTVGPGGIVITAGNPTNIYYGIQSLKTLFEPGDYRQENPAKKLTVKCVNVTDSANFATREVMLDVARNFQPAKEVYKLIDLLALYKLNTLHLHLNDDEGWRVEIQPLPELTDIGAKRGHSLNGDAYLPPAFGSGPAINTSAGSGYYTRAEFVSILKYATQRHIEVVPEIETPGHARAAIKAMAARYKRYIAVGDSVNANKYLLQTLNDSSVYRSVQKWNDNVMDVSLPSVYTFLNLVTDKLIEMYQQAGAPLKTIHFGGDEVPSGVWEKSASVMALKLKEPAIKTTADLWNYFFDRIGLMLAKKNLYISGWEETALMKIDVDGKKKWVPNPMFANRNFHVDVWNNLTGNEDLAYRLANSGYPVILSFVTNYYFDLAYDRSFNEHGFYWGGFINLEKSFKFIPFDYLKNQSVDYMNRPFSKETLQDSKKLTSSGRKNILGIQGLLWSETVTTPDRLEYMYLPRLLALAERAWTKEPEWMTEANSAKAGIDYESDWTKFGFSLGRELERLDIYGGGYHYRIPTPAFKIENGLVYANTDVPDFILRYTKDGSEPNSKSKLYRSGHPIPYGGSMVLRAFNRFGRGGNTVRVNASNYPK